MPGNTQTDRHTTTERVACVAVGRVYAMHTMRFNNTNFCHTLMELVILVFYMFYYYFDLSRMQSIAISVSVCLSVRLSVRVHI